MCTLDDLRCPTCLTQLQQVTRLASEQQASGDHYACQENHRFDVTFRSSDAVRAILTSCNTWSESPSSSVFLKDSHGDTVASLKAPEKCPCCNGKLSRYGDDFRCSTTQNSEAVPPKSTPTFRIAFREPLQEPFERVLSLKTNHQGYPQDRQWSVNTLGATSPVDAEVSENHATDGAVSVLPESGQRHAVRSPPI